MPNRHQIKSTSFLNAGVTTTISITLVLILLGLTILTGFGGREFITFVKEKMSISIKLPDTMKEAEVAEFQKKLSNAPYVKEVRFIDKDEIKQEIIASLGSDPEEVTGYEQSYSMLDIVLKSEYINSDSIKAIENKIKLQGFEGNFLFDEKDIEMVNANLSRVGLGLFILAIILMIISFTLIRNTIRLNIYSKRFLIHTMRLVGATNSFIRKPFVINFILCGMAAAILANIAITALVYAASKEFPEIIEIIRMENLLIVYASVFLLGILLTAATTAFSVNRYLKMETNTLYHV
ncbi:ABC transporter permease [Dysgonomonas sp. 520]|uniref:cell division protein FtsX n=1 Tax=Dysgonomonas sp. 520 TaxID=2302931 RepID=UPI0013D5B55F|nr:permease-like cell division protein FtsX [Dysgonomonas sp. 520]NDW11041.1 cell division protein FtsX [Dysgonomonas sp. 520]